MYRISIVKFVSSNFISTDFFLFSDKLMIIKPCPQSLCTTVEHLFIVPTVLFVHRESLVSSMKIYERNVALLCEGMT